MKLLSGFTLMVLLNVCLLAILLGNRYRSTPLTPKGNELPEASVIYDGLDEAYPGEPVASVYLFLHADGDCDCLDDWHNWVQLYTDFSDQVSVKGIFNGVEKSKLQAFAKELQLPFKIYEDKESALRKMYHVTPGQIVKVVISREGNVLYSDTYQAHPRDQKYFLKRVRSLIDWMNG